MVENGMVTDYWYTPSGYWDAQPEEEDAWEEEYEDDVEEEEEE